MFEGDTLCGMSSGPAVPYLPYIVHQSTLVNKNSHNKFSHIAVDAAVVNQSSCFFLLENSFFGG